MASPKSFFGCPGVFNLTECIAHLSKFYLLLTVSLFDGSFFLNASFFPPLVILKILVVSISYLSLGILRSVDKLSSVMFDLWESWISQIEGISPMFSLFRTLGTSGNCFHANPMPEDFTMEEV